MYSRGYSEKQRLFNGVNGTQDKDFSLPPRYSGVRFTKEKRSDGREGVYERTYTASASMTASENEERLEESDNSATAFETLNENEKFHEAVGCEPPESNVEGETRGRFEKSKLSELYSFMGEDDLLIIGLILIFAGQHGIDNREIILLLAILLCFR